MNTHIHRGRKQLSVLHVSLHVSKSKTCNIFIFLNAWILISSGIILSYSFMPFCALFLEILNAACKGFILRENNNYWLWKPAVVTSFQTFKHNYIAFHDRATWSTGTLKDKYGTTCLEKTAAGQVLLLFVVHASAVFALSLSSVFLFIYLCSFSPPLPIFCAHFLANFSVSLDEI